LNEVSSVVWSSCFFSKVQYKREPSRFLHLFPEISLILKNKNFPDYFGSYNNSALTEKGEKSGAF